MSQQETQNARDDETLERLATYGEVAQETGLPLGSLYSLVAQNRIPHIRLGRRCVRFSRRAVQAWLRAQTKAGEKGK